MTEIPSQVSTSRRPSTKISERQSRVSVIRRRSSIARTILTQHRLSTVGTSKAMEFPADGPGRVIVRLERLMGSDRIRITDTKYMSTLLQKLVEEEEITWKNRTRERRKAEHQRFRQLVIDGYMDPAPGMEDLYNHPVFRVNRILARLDKLNAAITPVCNLPPITPVDPFQYDYSGRVFKTYPGHMLFSKDRESIFALMSVKSSEEERAIESKLNIPSITGIDGESEDDGEFEWFEEGEDEEEIENAENMGEFISKISAPTRKESKGGPTDSPTNKLSENSLSIAPQGSSRMSGARRLSRLSSAGLSLSSTVLHKHLSAHVGFTSALDLRKLSRGKGSKDTRSDTSVTSGTSGKPEIPKKLTLQEIQKIYGIAPGTNLGTQWKPYQAPLVQKLFQDEKKGLSKLYELGKEITSMYQRQQETTDEYLRSITGADQENHEEEEEEEETNEEKHIDLTFNSDSTLSSPKKSGEYFADLENGDDGYEPDLEDMEPLPSSKSGLKAESPPTWDDFVEATEEDDFVEATEEDEVEEEGSEETMDV